MRTLENPRRRSTTTIDVQTGGTSMWQKSAAFRAVFKGPAVEDIEMLKGKARTTTALIAFGLHHAGSAMAWELLPTPTNEDLIGVSAATDDFAIAVGNGGTIVHFRDGDDGTLQASGTTNDLFDVYMASPNAAIAVGRDIVLYWDGSSWATGFESTADLIYTGTWITPEEDAAIYGQLAEGFTSDLICPFDPSSTTQDGFCRAYSSPMLTACGNSNDIKVVLGSGDVLHLDNDVGDASGPEPLYEAPTPLGFTGAWIVPGSCISGPRVPSEMYATRTNEIWRFDGSQWVDQNVAVPSGDTLTWISGNGSNSVTAVGFRPGANPSLRKGIAFRYDGTKWAQQTLPSETPGLTDVATRLKTGDAVFVDGFEAEPQSDVVESILAAAEEGKRLERSISFSGTIADIAVSKDAITLGPYRNGEEVEFRLQVFNLGPRSQNATVYDGFKNTLSYVSGDCGSQPDSNRADWQYRRFSTGLIGPLDSFSCTMTFSIVGTSGQEIVNQARGVVFASEFDIENNEATFSDVIQP